MNRFHRPAWLFLLALSLPLLFTATLACAFETAIHEGPRGGFFSVTLTEEECAGKDLANLTAKPVGSHTFGLRVATTRLEIFSTISEGKACWAQLRILQGAVEMYNMDNPTPLARFDGKTAALLVEKGYVKEQSIHPQPGCEFMSESDFPTSGRIVCRRHGHPGDSQEAAQVRQAGLSAKVRQKPRLVVSGRFLNGGAVAFQLCEMGSGNLVQTFEILPAADRSPNKEPSRTWTDLTLSRLAVLKALTPHDPILGYLEKQLPRVYTPLTAPQHSTPESRWNGRNELGRPDLYALTSGGLAIQESLQLDRMANPETPTGKPTIAIGKLQGPTIKSHPFTEMIGTRTPAVYPIDALVPETFYSCHFSDINRHLAFGDFIDRWGSNLLHSFDISSRDSRLKEKLQGQLCLETSELTRLFGDQVIADLTICGADPFLQEGSDLTIVFTLKNRALFDMSVGRYITRAMSEHAGTTQETLTIEDTTVKAVTSPDRQVRSYSCDHGEYKIYSNSLSALTKVLSVARKRTPSLAEAADYRYMRTVFPADPAREDAFLYLSDAHIRQLVGPVWKIGRQRQLQCQASLRILQGAVTLSRMLALPGPITLENLYKTRALEQGYLRCPDGGIFTWDDPNGEAVCSVHGRLRYLTPIIETQPTLVTKDEQTGYDRFVSEYNQYWRQYFDPIGIRATLSPERVQAETCILPLIESSTYNGFKRLSGGTPVKIDLPNHPRAIFQLIGKLDPQGAATLDPRSGDLASNLVSGTGLTIEQFFQAVGSAFVLGLVDSSVKFDIDGSLLGGLMPGVGPDTAAMLTFSYLMASLNLPVYALIEIRDRHLTEQFLRAWLTRAAVENARIAGGSRMRFFDLRFYESAPTKGEQPVFTLDMLLLVIRWRIHFAVRDNCLIIASQRPLLEELIATSDRLKTETNLETRINYRAFKEISETTRLRWQERIRDACLGGLGSLYSLTAFRGTSPTAWDQQSLKVHGAIPYCPLGGTLSFDHEADTVSCSLHGDALHPRQPWNPDPAAPLNKLIDAMRGVSASLRFTPEGIMTTVVMEFAK